MVLAWHHLRWEVVCGCPIRGQHQHEVEEGAATLEHLLRTQPLVELHERDGILLPPLLHHYSEVKQTQNQL